MLTLPEKFLFALLAALSLYFAYTGFSHVVKATARGEAGFYPRFNRLTERLGEAIARTVSQVTVFRARPLASFFHAFIFYGFIFYVLVNVVDLVEGFVPPTITHQLEFGLAGGLFRLGADLFSALVIVGVLYFLARRFIVRDKRLNVNAATPVHEDVAAGGIRRDSLIVGGFIFGHVGFRLLGASFLVSQAGSGDPWQPVASLIASGLPAGGAALIGWHLSWWGALGLILLFLPYFPRSKHIHLFAAPAKFAFERRQDDLGKLPLGVLEPVDFEDEAAEQFGVAKLEDLRQTQILDAYACIQCMRCTNVCPAQVTGKALSPAHLEINKRYELNRVAPLLAAGGESPRPVMDFMLDEESLWACTACGACMEICPVGCEQMIDIVDIRRDRVMMQGEFPAELNAAFRGMERTGNPWGIGQDERDEWRSGLAVPTVEENPDFEVLYWVGCAGAYDPSAQKTARALAEIMSYARVNFAILGRREKCTGDPARRAGNEYLYYQLATDNVELLNDMLVGEKLANGKRKRVVTGCPHCFNALRNDYPQLGGQYDVVHHSQLIDELMMEGRLPPMDIAESVTFHDPCYLGRHNEVFDAPRNILNRTGFDLREMARSGRDSFCCGAGGAQFWKEEESGRERVSDNRFEEARATGAGQVAAACPFCKVMLKSTDRAEEDGAPDVVDIAEIVADNLKRYHGRVGTASD